MLAFFILLGYFLAATAAMALVFLPDLRAALLSGARRELGRLQGWARTVEGRGECLRSQAGAVADLWQVGARYLHSHARETALAVTVLLVLPLLALLWRHWQAVDTFDHTDLRVRDERIAALLAGERLVPPAPLPPDVFTTREVEAARPLVRFASRDWALLDTEFSQRLLMVFRLMRERHGYDMVLIEGYRSPQRQAQLAAMGGHVTQAGAYRSYHQFGLAADCAFLRDGKVVISEKDGWAMRGYELYGDVSAELGLTWGGGWKRLKDLGHVELRRPGVIKRQNEEPPPEAAYAS